MSLMLRGNAICTHACETPNQRSETANQDGAGREGAEREERSIREDVEGARGSAGHDEEQRGGEGERGVSFQGNQGAARGA